MLYSYNDLVWEAVRRNQEYRDYCNSLRDENGSIQPKSWEPYLAQRWSLKTPFDFNVTADDIIEMVVKGKMAEEDHPYHNYYQSRLERVECLELPTENYAELKRLKQGIGNKQIQNSLVEWASDVCLSSKNRIVISLDPFENEETLKQKILELKKKAVEREKEKLNLFLENLEKRRGVWRDDYKACHLYHSEVHKPKIFNYIENLEKYDDIFSKTISLASESNDKSFCRIVCGALYLPKKFKFRIFLDDHEIEDQKLKTNGYDEAVKNKDDKLMSKVTINATQALEKYYARSYETASAIIRSAPDRIYFYS